MTDRELEDRLRRWYAADVGEVDGAPADLRGRVVGIPRSAPVSRRTLRGRRGLTLLAAAALLVGGGVAAFGSGLGRLPTVFPPTPSDEASVESPVPTSTPTSTPSTSPEPPASTSTPAPTPEPSPGFSGTGASALGEDVALDETATLLSDGRVLVTEGCGTGAELYDPATGTFVPTGSLTVARYGATATLLRDGRVLIAGGYDCDSADAIWPSAELYDPSTGRFSPTGPMRVGREFHTATLLPDGRVLVAGGLTGPNPTTGSIVLASVRTAATSSSVLATAEIYDPGTGTFSPTDAMSAARMDHTATLLADGRVLVTGGGGEALASSRTADVYDPSTDTFGKTGSMRTGRYLHTATLLTDGRVLVLGGRSPQDSVFDEAEIWDPSTGKFRAAGVMTEGRQQHTATRLPDGRVLITGGYWSDGHDGRALSSTELFDPATGVFSPNGSMGTPRDGHTATLLHDGRVLIAGGSDLGENGAEPVAEAVLYQP